MFNCKKLQQDAVQYIPGLTQLLSKNPTRFSSGVWPSYYSRSKGAYVWDADNNKFLDMSISGIGSCILGYADDDIDNAVIAAVRSGVACSLNCPEEVELAKELCALHPWAQMARFSRTGGEAMAIAVRIARAYTQKSVILFCGYHGWHDWYIAANLGGKDALGGHLIKGISPNGVPVELKGTSYAFKFNDVEALQNLVHKHKDRLAAIVLEPVRNSQPTQEFIDVLSRAAADNCVPLIADEISSGFRLCNGGAHLMYQNFTPDIAVFSKALGNGYAISAIIGKSKYMSVADETFISSTNWTERIGPVAALATIKKFLDCSVAEKLKHLGMTVQQGWKLLSDKYSIELEIGGMYPISHFTFADRHLEKRAAFVQLMLDKNILASTDYYAMYAHSDDHLDQYLSACDSSFETIANTSDFSSFLKGKPSVSGFGRLT